MAQGRQERLPDVGRKHLLPLYAEKTILSRTLEIVNEYSSRNVVVVGWPEIENTALRGRARFFCLPDPGDCILEGLSQTYELDLWGPGRTIVLLGDVVYSRLTLRRIFEDDRKFFFAGTRDLSPAEGEIFALSFDARGRSFGAIYENPADFVAQNLYCCHDRGVHQPGQLRHVLWRLMKVLDLRQRVPEIYLSILDWTKDVDTPADLELLPKLAKLAEADDLR